MKTIYQIDGMHCGSCVKKITEALTGMAENVDITLDPPRATLSGNVLPDLSAINVAVYQVGGYKLKPLADEPFLTAKVEKSWLATYYPLLLIVGLIATVSFKGAVSPHEWMLNFMAGFFIVFGFFKLLDIKGFRDAYGTYDLLAKRWPNYGFIYPFLELGLGLAFLFQFQLTAALWFSIALMGFSSLGVVEALRKKQKIQCACLGTVLNLPMSTITLVEDLGMVIMAIIMVAGI